MLALTTRGSELEGVLDEAARLSKKPWYARFLRSKQNADTINDLREKIDQACQTFQVTVHAAHLLCNPMDDTTHTLAASRKHYD